MTKEEITKILESNNFSLREIFSYKTQEGFNLWHLCAKQKDSLLFNKICALFSSEQIKEKLNEKNELGDSPAHLAAWVENKEVLKTIVKYNTNLDYLDSQNRNIAMIVIKIKPKDKELINYTLEHTKQINQQDNQKRTILHYAQHFSDPEIYEKIISLGCNLNIKSRFGEKPKSPHVEFTESILDFVNKNTIIKKRLI